MSEIIKQYKIFWMWEFEKEEKWLNDLAKNGLELIDIPNPFLYYFKKSNDMKNIKIEYLFGKDKLEKEKYIDFLKSTGIEHIKGNKGWHYFKSFNNENFEIYSDNTSKIKLYNRILKPLWIVVVLNLIAGFINMVIPFILSDDNMSNFLMGVSNILIGLSGILGCKKINEKKIKLEEESLLFDNEI